MHIPSAIINATLGRLLDAVRPYVQPLLSAGQAKADAYGIRQIGVAKADATRAIAAGQADATRILAEASADAQRQAAQGDADAILERALALRGARRILAPDTPLLSSPPVESDIVEVSVDFVPEVPSLAERATARVQMLEQKRQENVENIVGNAYEEIKNDPSDAVEEGKVEADWTTRFFRLAEDVSDEDMQRIWAKLLAGEAKRPGSISPRTLDVLKNLTKSEALIFQKACQWMTGVEVGTCALINVDDQLASTGSLSFMDIVVLQSAGLLASTIAAAIIVRSVDSSAFRGAVRAGGEALIFRSNEPIKEVHIPAYIPTPAASELARIAGQRADPRLWTAIKQHITKIHPNLTVTLAVATGSGSTFSTGEETAL